jgi:putative cell wall-binding protein
MTAQRFDLATVTWDHGAAAAGTQVRIRVHEQGAWTPWQTLEADGDGPDAGSTDAARAASSSAPDSTAPLLTAGSDGVQVRVDTPGGTAPQGLHLDLVDAGRSAADAPTTASGPADAAQAATPEPGVVTRRAWGADESLAKTSPAINGSVRALIVHHTDTSNGYTPAQAYAQVRSLYTFHTKIRGWNDVGYNFIVDRYGRVYEGRRGSLSEAVMGAHAGGFNAQTLGIAVLGTFSTDAAPAAVTRALVPLLAWQAALNGINPVGRTTLISSGGSYTPYSAGTPVSVYGVSGHRNVDSTECPGNDLFPALSVVRSLAAARMRPDLLSPTLSGGLTGVGEAPVTFAADVPTTQRWWLRITRLCGGTTIRTISGTTRSHIQGSWDLRDASGRPVPPGAYTVTVTSSSPVGIIPAWVRDVEVLPTAASSALPPASRLPIGVISPSTAASGSVVTAPTGQTVTRAGTTTQATTTPATIGVPVLPTTPTTSTTATRVTTVSGVTSTSGAPTTTAPSTTAPNATAAPTSSTTAVPTSRTTVTPTGAPTGPTSAPTTGSGPAAGWSASGNGCPVQRLAVGDPALSSVLAGRLSRPTAQTVVLVSAAAGEGIGQALAAAPLAAAQRAPLLLTGASDLPPAVAQDIAARKVSTAWLVGSTAVISPAVEQQLHDLGVATVRRVAGADRWATAAAVASEVGAASHQAVLASGDPGEQLDTLVAASAAAAAGRPVLLTTRTGIPAATLAALRRLRVTSVSVIGSTVAVPDATLAALSKAGVTGRSRLVGADRFTTAAAIDTAFAAQLPSDRVVLASGMEAAADLLVASGQGRAVLLTTASGLPSATSAWLTAHRPAAVSLVARPDAVSTAVLREAGTTLS